MSLLCGSASTGTTWCNTAACGQGARHRFAVASRHGVGGCSTWKPAGHVWSRPNALCRHSKPATFCLRGIHSCHSLREALVTKLQSTLQLPLLCRCTGEWFGLARAASEQSAVLVHTYRQRLASDAFDAWLCLVRQRRQFRVAVGRVTRRKERFDFLRLRNYVQGWRGFSAQALRFHVAAGKVERFHTLAMARRAYEFWSTWIRMLRMSAGLKAIGAQQLLRQVVWLWWEETFSRKRSAAAEKNWNTAIAVAHAAAVF